MPKQDVVHFAAGLITQPNIECISMKNTEIKYKSYKTIKPNPFNEEALEFWDERARPQLSYMNAISAYLD